MFITHNYLLQIPPSSTQRWEKTQTLVRISLLQLTFHQILLSHFISVATRGQSKLSVKIPKWMIKTMQSRSQSTKRGNQFPKKVVSIFSSVFGKNRSLGKKDEDHSDSESLLGRSDSQDEKEWHFTAEETNLVHANRRIVGPLSQLIKLEVDNTLEPHDAEEGKHRHAVLPLASFVDEEKSYRDEADRGSTHVVNGWGLLRIKVTSCCLVRVASRVVTITGLLKKKVREQVEDDRKREEDEEEACLCKKRILMGGRCKPLCSSGPLQYDSDGILIPDTVV